MTLFLKKIGALTSKPYAFTARPWELKRYNTIDLFDSLGSNLIVDVRNSEIMRITPQLNNKLNEEWITDKARFSYDLLNKWRFNTPVLKINDNFINISWKEALVLLEKKIHCKRTLINLKIGSILDLESLFLLKKLIYKNENIFYKSEKKIHSWSIDFSSNKSTKYLLYDINLRLLNPILNLKLRKKSIKLKNSFIYIGNTVNSTIYIRHLGLGLVFLKKVFSGKSFFSKELMKKDICLITTYTNITKNFHVFTKNINYLSEYHIENNLTALNLPNKKGIKTVKDTINYFIGQFFEKKIKGFTILQSSFISKKIIKEFDLVLPTLNWFEEEQKNLNCFLLPQVTSKVLQGPFNAKSNKEILGYLLKEKDLSHLNLELGFNSKKIVKTRMPLTTKYPSKVIKKPNNIIKYNYHLSSDFLANSKTMLKSSRDFFKGKNDFLIDTN